ncbi:MAG: adenylate/guanylate cyclase domain-containing protein, partial [Myxococcota bacterium]
HYRNMDLGPCFEHLDRAIERLEQGPLQRELVQARVERLRAQLTPGWSPWDQLADVEPLEQILERLGEDELAQRGQAAAILSDAYWTAGQYEQGEAWAREAIRIGHELGDDLLCSQALVALGMAQAERLHLGDSLATLQEALERSRRGGDLWLAGHPLQRLPLVLTSLGRLSEAEPHAEEGCRATRTIQDWAEHSLSLATRVVIAVARGRFEEAERDCEEVVAIAGRSHYPWGAAIAIAAVCSAQVMVGRYQEAERGLDRLAMPGVVFQEAGPAIEFLVRVYRELVRAMQGSRAESDQPPTISLLAQPDAQADLQTLGLFCAGVEIAARRKDTDLAARCYAPIAAASERGALLSNNWIFLVPRVLGVAARLNGWWERGAAHFEHALRAASEAGAEPEYARACLDYAQLLHQRRGPGDLEVAIELVERASPRFEGLGMHPFADETAQLAAKLGLRPVAASVEARIERSHPLAPASAPRVLLVTDMQGFTNLLDRLGDQAVETLLDHHNQILRACLHDHRGREIQHTGDGFILSFDAAGNALGCAIAMQKDLARYNARHPDRPIRVREGLHAGKALPVE